MVCSVDNRKSIALTVPKLLRFKYFIIINEGPFSRKLSHIIIYGPMYTAYTNIMEKGCV